MFWASDPMLQDSKVTDTEQNVLCHDTGKFPVFQIFQCMFCSCCHAKLDLQQHISFWQVNW